MYMLHNKMVLPNGGDRVYHIFNGRDKAHYRVGKREYDFLQQLKDGKTYDELLANNDFEKAELEEYLNQIEGLNFLEKRMKVKRKITKIYLLSFNTSNWTRNWATLLYEFLVFGLFFLFILGCFGAFLFEPQKFLTTFSLQQGTLIDWAANIILFIVITILSYAIHELAHALTAINAGVMVPEIGGILYFFSPVGYADVTGLRFLESKLMRFKILIAGLVTNSVIALASFLWLFLSGPNPFLQDLLYSNLLIIVFNLCFFLKLDGYYLLEIIMDEPALREKSLIYIRKIMGLHRGDLPSILLVDKFVYFTIGVISMFYLPLLFGNIIIRSVLFIWGR